MQAHSLIESQASKASEHPHVKVHRSTCMLACMQGPSMIVPESVKPYTARGKPHACELCRQRIAHKLGFEAGQARLIWLPAILSVLLNLGAPVQSVLALQQQGAGRQVQQAVLKAPAMAVVHI